MKITLVNAYPETAKSVKARNVMDGVDDTEIELDSSKVNKIDTRYYSNQVQVHCSNGDIWNCDEVEL